MAYKVTLSNKSSIPIDREELESVKKGIETGARLIKVKSGIFNPAYIVSVEPDYKRLEGIRALDHLPDMFERIGKMKTIEELAEEKKLELEAPKVPQEKIDKLLKKYKPNFLK